ncbi:fibronectin type III domain-containing protein [Streptomyces sp. NPDC012751]|uniref:fibronectin type III domain-containing protein n=1 Tax=Streptomyces sp. NPDC012751 TaxID=3364846 RepID=UPI0036B9AF80
MRLRKGTRRFATTASVVALLATASLTTAFGSEKRAATALTAAPLTTWQTDGTVWSLAYAHGVVYAGGDFDRVRPPGAGPGEREVARKNFAAFDAVTGELLPCTHSFTNGPADSVRALKTSPDGRVLYVGGSFGKADGVGVANAVALNTADCSLRGQFRPGVSGTVRAIDTTADAVYLGGDFESVAGRTRRHVASLRPDGSLLPFTADADKPVRAVLAAPDHGKVLLGGDFHEVNGKDEGGLVAVHPSTGATVTSYPQWLPRKSSVHALTRDDTTFYLGADGNGTGIFDGRIAGRLSGSDMVWKDSCWGATQAVVVHQGVLYSGTHAHDCAMTPGGFPEFNHRQHFLAQSAGDRHILYWFPDTDDGIGEGAGPRALVMAGGILWAGGEFTAVNGGPQQGLTRFGAGPRDSAPEGTPRLSAASTRAGRVTLTWRAAWDRDDAELTYLINRDGKPLTAPKKRSAAWDRPDMTYRDSVTPGSRHQYTIAVTDGRNTTRRSDPLSVTAATGTRR